MVAMSNSSSDEDNISHSASTTLFFDEADSSSEDSDPADGPRRRCSFVSNSSGPIMDLRYPASVSGDKSYDLSVCSVNSLSTIETSNALEKMGMFEVALSRSAGYKKKEDEGALHKSNSYPDQTKIGWLHKMRMKRHTSDHGGMFHHSSVVLPGSGDANDSIFDKKSKTCRKKAYIRRCVQAAAIILLLSTLTGSIIFFETFDKNQMELFRTEISRTMAHLFGMSSDREVRKVEVEEQEEVDRMMVQQLQSTIHEASIHEAPMHEAPPTPIDNHEHNQFFIQEFRNNQKISQRLNNDPMRLRKTLQSGTNVDHDKVAHISVQEFLDSQKLAREGAHAMRRRLDEPESEV